MKILFIFVFLSVFFCGTLSAEISFDFDKSDQGWEIPDWALEQPDCAGMFLEVAEDKFSQNKGALKINCDFQDNTWMAAVVEYKNEIDLKGYRSISADVYIPDDSKGGPYQVRIILIAGTSWWWIEMKYPVQLEKGKWTTVKAKLDVNIVNEKFFWTRQAGRESGIVSNLQSVKKIIIRVEAENSSGLFGDNSYTGPIYIDNIVIT